MEVPSPEEANVDGIPFDPGSLPELVVGHAERTPGSEAQRYKAAYDRSMVPGVFDAPGDGHGSVTYGELEETVGYLAAGFREIGVDPGEIVGMYGSTRMEWLQAALGVLAAGSRLVTVYPDYSSELAGEILSEGEATAVVAENGELLGRVIAVRDRTDVEVAVTLDETEVHGDREFVYSLAEVYERGRRAFDRSTYEEWLADLDRDDLAIVMYSSGTTGDPTGIRLTHGNVLSNVDALLRRFGPRPDKEPSLPVVDGDTRFLAHLPIAHIHELSADQFHALGAGATIAYSESADTIGEDLELFSPTALATTPAVLDGVVSKIREGAADSGVKSRLVEWALDLAAARGRGDLGPLGRAQYALADRLVFSTVREKLGGQLRMAFWGGSSLDTRTANVYDGIGILTVGAYGLTEAAPVVASNPPIDPREGTVGPPLYGVEVEVDPSVGPGPDFYGVEGETGELRIRGPNVTPGYWKDDESNEWAFVGDGWLRTGDVMTLRPDGYLVFHEREKHILALTDGRNVSPTPIEEAIERHRMVDHAMLVGDERPKLTALLSVNVDAVRAWADREGVDLPDDPGAITSRGRVNEQLNNQIERVNEQHEEPNRIEDFRAVPDEFTQDNGLLTATRKKKRHAIEERFADTIESMYETESPPTPSD